MDVYLMSLLTFFIGFHKKSLMGGQTNVRHSSSFCVVIFVCVYAFCLQISWEMDDYSMSLLTLLMVS